MNSVERQIVTNISDKKAQITSLDSLLEKLNYGFPGERRKRQGERNTHYQQLRKHLLDKRRGLSAEVSKTKIFK